MPEQSFDPECVIFKNWALSRRLISSGRLSILRPCIPGDAGSYLPNETPTWVKIRNQAYSQWIGRESISDLRHTTCRPMLFLKNPRVAGATRESILSSPVLLSASGTFYPIVADWQANGRIAVASPNPAPPQQGVNNLAAQDTTVTPKVAALDAATTPTVTQDAPPKPTVALELQTTARAQKYCKPQTFTDVMSDTTAYLTAKGVAMGTIAVSSYKLTLVVDRPLSKWIKITVQMRDHSGSLLWSETVQDGGWGHAGGTGTLNVLDKMHQIMDAKLVLCPGNT